MRERLTQALTSAIKRQDKRRVATFRLIQAAIKDRDIAHRGIGKDPVTDEEIMEILVRMVKQRNESALIYDQAKRPELANEEREEIAIIQEFLPQPMSDEEIKRACAETIQKIGAQGLRDMGQVMNALKEEYAGRMDFSKASIIVRSSLS